MALALASRRHAPATPTMTPTAGPTTRRSLPMTRRTTAAREALTQAPTLASAPSSTRLSRAVRTAIGETVIFADALSPSLLEHLLKVEGGAQNDSLADGQVRRTTSAGAPARTWAVSPAPPAPGSSTVKTPASAISCLCFDRFERCILNLWVFPDDDDSPAYQHPCDQIAFAGPFEPDDPPAQRGELRQGRHARRRLCANTSRQDLGG